MADVFFAYLQKKISLTPAQIEAITELIKPLKVKKGEALLREGDVSKHGYFIESGCLRSYVIDEKGKEHIIQFAPENWWIGASGSLAGQEPSMIFIDAIEDSQIVQFGRDFMEKMESIVPGYAAMNQSLLQNRFRAVQKRLVMHLSATASERYEDFIKTYPSLALRLPQHMIASYIGVAPQSLSRLRGQAH